jgi:hypothetical protein
LGSSAIFFVLFFYGFFTFADSVNIPIKTVKKPAADLSYQGRRIDPSEATELASKQVDISRLNPTENKFWQDKKYEISDASINDFPASQTGVIYQATESVINELLTVTLRVQDAKNKDRFYRLAVSRYSPSFMMRAAMLRKLGFYVPVLKQVSDMKIRFNSEAEKDLFLEDLQKGMVLDINDTPWIKENNKTDHTLTVADSILETPSSEYYDLHWGTTPNPKNPAMVSILELFSKNRAFRALIVPYVLVDLPESVNRFLPKSASAISGHIVMNHPFGAAFSATTYEDVKWLLLRMQNWTEKDVREIVNNANLPKDISELVYRKLLYRISNLHEFLDLKTNFQSALPTLEYDAADGKIKNGKVMQETFPGYPFRFAHGDPEAPFQEGDYARYFKIRGITSAISTALNEISKKLQIQGVDDLARKRGQEIRKRITDHIAKSPLEPLYQKVEVWGGPIGGFDVSATRHVSTGTYFDSSAPIQLVDNLSVSGSIGYFMGIDGLNYVKPFGGVNVSLLRDYTHVRPILSIKEGDKEDWKNLIVPKFMSKISKILKEPGVVSTAETVTEEKASLDQFLNELREGEVFTITDSITTSAYAQISSSLDVLMGIAPLNFMNSISLGGDASRIVLRQTSIMKTKDGVQIFVRNQKNTLYGVTVDLNYFINLLKIRSQTNINDLKTHAFVINYYPALQQAIDARQNEIEFVNKNNEVKENLRPVLYSLFNTQSTELLYEKFPYNKFEIDHHLKTKELRIKFLWSRTMNMTEDHLVSVRYPKSEAHPELNPKDEEIVLFSSKKGELTGRDNLGFGLDILQGILNKKSKVNWDLGNNLNPNPSSTPFGNSYWRMVNSEGDLSTTQKKQYPSIATIQHVWGGWHLKKRDFFKILDEVESKIKGVNLSSYRLLERENFHQVNSIDFYRITAQMSLMPSALSKIQDLIVPKEVTVTKQDTQFFVSRLFKKLSEKIGSKERPEDREMFNSIMKIFGNGDYQAGYTKYYYECQEYHRTRTSQEVNAPDNTMAWLNGSYYECLTPWVEKLIKLSTSFPKEKKAQIKWLTEVLYVLDEQIPIQQLLQYLTPENYIYLVRVNGFRTGDEDGEIQYFSNTLGDPTKNIEYANGLIQMFSQRTGVSSIELDRSQGSFR